MRSPLFKRARDAAQQALMPQQWRSTACARIVRGKAPPQTTKVYATLSTAPIASICAPLTSQPSQSAACSAAAAAAAIDAPSFRSPVVWRRESALACMWTKVSRLPALPSSAGIQQRLHDERCLPLRVIVSTAVHKLILQVQHACFDYQLPMDSSWKWMLLGDGQAP